MVALSIPQLHRESDGRLVRVQLSASGICGWINGQREADPAHATLDAMREALRDRDSPGPRPIVSGPCAYGG